MIVVCLLLIWGRPWHALAVAVVLALQFAAMRVLFRDPKGKAPWYNATGVSLYVTGMMITAFAVRTLGAGG
jgi:chlorophyll synthase